jgi:hypothetical protein
MWGTPDWWGSKLQGLGYYAGSTRPQVRSEEIGRVPSAPAHVGRKRIFFECFWFDTEKTIEGLRPSFPAHVRCSEGAPVQFPPKFPGSVAIALLGSEVGGLVDELEAYRHEPEG